MRTCQCCGACSWGPAAQPGRLKCDACESIALKSVIDEPKPSPVVEDPFALGLTAMTASLKDLAPPPRPDRTERLVHTLLQSDLLDTNEVDTAESIVQFARDIEQALDRPIVIVSDKPLLGWAELSWFDSNVRTFPLQRDLLDWLTRGFAHAKQSLGETGVPNHVNVERFAGCFMGWLLKGAPLE